MLRRLFPIRTALFASPLIYRFTQEQQHQIYNLSLHAFGALPILSQSSFTSPLPFPSIAGLRLIRLQLLKQC
jgi:hypothetical protein